MMEYSSFDFSPFGVDKKVSSLEDTVSSPHFPSPRFTSPCFTSPVQSSPVQSSPVQSSPVLQIQYAGLSGNKYPLSRLTGSHG